MEWRRHNGLGAKGGQRRTEQQELRIITEAVWIKQQCDGFLETLSNVMKEFAKYTKKTCKAYICITCIYLKSGNTKLWSNKYQAKPSAFIQRTNLQTPGFGEKQKDDWCECDPLPIDQIFIAALPLQGSLFPSSNPLIFVRTHFLPQGWIRTQLIISLIRLDFAHSINVQLKLCGC